MNSFLKYGDVISLYCVDGGGGKLGGGGDNDRSEEARGNRHGFLGGMGFTDDGIYMQMQVKMVDDGLDKISTPRNFRRFLMELTPKLGCEAHDDYERTLKYYRELIRNSSFQKKGPDRFNTMRK